MNDLSDDGSLLPSSVSSPWSADNPRWREVAGALAAFFAGGAGPTHSAVGRAFGLAGYDEPPEFGTKEDRVRQAIRKSDDDLAARLVEEVLGLLRNGGVLTSDNPNVSRLRVALSRIGATLSAEGFVDWQREVGRSADVESPDDVRAAADDTELGQAAMILLDRGAAATAGLLLEVDRLAWEPKPADYAPEWADSIAVLVVSPHVAHRFTEPDPVLRTPRVR